MKTPPPLIAAVLLLAAAHIQAKPVLLMGNNYGRHERERWVEQVLNEDRIDFKTSDVWVPPSQWENYCAVMIADVSPLKSPDSATQAEIIDYLESGGTLICMEGGISSLLGMPNGVGPVPAWAASWIRANTITRLNPAQNYSVADDSTAWPWPNDMTAQLTYPQWLNYFYVLHNFTDATQTHAVITDETNTKGIVVVSKVGDGFFIHIGRMLFRVQAKQSYEKACQAKARSENLRTAIRRTILNLNPTRVHESNADQVRQDFNNPSHEWICWKRDPEIDPELYAGTDIARYPRFSPPWPLTHETLSQDEIHLGCGNEIFSYAFNIFPLSNLANFQVSIVPVNPNNLPPQAVEICVQDCLAPPQSDIERPMEQFWLRPLSAGVALKKAETMIFWLRLKSENLTPGSYSLKLRLTDGITFQDIPLTVKVSSAPYAPEYGMRENFYGVIWGSENLHNLDLINGKLTEVIYTHTYENLAPVLEATRSLGTVNMNGGDLWMNTIKIVKPGHSQHGKTLQQFHLAFKANPSLDFLRIENPAVPQVPKLDFSGLDGRLQVARDIGLNRITIRHGQFSQTGTNYIQQLTGEPWVPGPDQLSERWKITFCGLWSQFRWYLHSKGFTERYFKYGDELPPDVITNAWLPIAKLVRTVGWGPEINLTAAAVKPDKINEIASEIRAIAINENFVDAFLADWHSRKFYLSPWAKVSTYGSWGYHKSPPIYCRKEWWETFAKGAAGNRLHGLDIYNVNYLQTFDGTNVFMSAAAEGWRAGWNESGYLMKLRTLYNENASNADPAVIAWRGQVQDFLANFIAPSSSQPPSSAYYHGMHWETLDDPLDSFPPQKHLKATTEQLDLSRRDVLALLAACPLL